MGSAAAETAQCNQPCYGCCGWHARDLTPKNNLQVWQAAQGTRAGCRTASKGVQEGLTHVGHKLGVGGHPGDDLRHSKRAWRQCRSSGVYGGSP